MYSLLCRGKVIEFDRPLIMGIINATPDSFFRSDIAGGVEGAVALAGRMLGEGADLLDLGGQSTRPGAEKISEEAELSRVIPVITSIVKAFPDALISIDTFYPAVAKVAFKEGAAMINDVSGGNNSMFRFAAESRMPYVLTHSKPLPKSANDEMSVMTALFDYFSFRTRELIEAGMHDIIIDPGFGFKKNADINFMILRNLSMLQPLGKPILAGISRKRTVWQTINSTPQEALNGTTVLNTIALQNGANILRVHDVKEAVEARTLVAALTQKK